MWEVRKSIEESGLFYVGNGALRARDSNGKIKRYKSKAEAQAKADELNEEEKCRIYFAKVYELKKEEAMKTKIGYEKLTYDVWDLSELKEPFENCKLYCKALSGFLPIKNITQLTQAVFRNDEMYKQVEPLSLEKEIEAIKCNDLLFLARPHREEILIHHGDCVIDINFDTFHKISETLKRHGK